MSAFVVSRPHIAALVEALYRYEVYPGECDGDALGQMLWEENITSVLYRYPKDTRETMPGPCEEDFVFVWTRNPARTTRVRDPWFIFTLVHCYNYQSCEHDDWEQSEASYLMQALEERLLTAMKMPDAKTAMKHKKWNEGPWGLDVEPV